MKPKRQTAGWRNDEHEPTAVYDADEIDAWLRADRAETLAVLQRASNCATDAGYKWRMLADDIDALIAQLDTKEQEA